MSEDKTDEDNKNSEAAENLDKEDLALKLTSAFSEQSSTPEEDKLDGVELKLAQPDKETETAQPAQETSEPVQPLRQGRIEAFNTKAKRSAEKSQAEPNAAPVTPIAEPPTSPSEKSTELPRQTLEKISAKLKISKPVIALALVAVFAGLWFLSDVFSGSDTTNVSSPVSSTKSMKELIKQQEEVLAKEKAKPEPKKEIKKINWTANIKNETLTGSLELSTADDILQTAQIELTSSTPPEMSNEDIVRGVFRPWMPRFSSDQLKPAKDSSTKLQKLIGDGRAYIQTGDKRTRLIASVEVNLTYKQSEDGLYGTWKVSHGDTASVENNAFVVRKDEKDNYVLLLQGSFFAKPKN